MRPRTPTLDLVLQAAELTSQWAFTRALPAPWETANRTLFLGPHVVGLLDPLGYLLMPRAVRVLIEVGPADVSPALTDDATTFVLGAAPSYPSREHVEADGEPGPVPRSARVPAVVSNKTGLVFLGKQTVRSVTLASILGLIHPRHSPAVLKVSAQVDIWEVLGSAGPRLSRVQRIILGLHGVQSVASARDFRPPHVVMVEHGFEVQCCLCWDSEARAVNCFYSRGRAMWWDPLWFGWAFANIRACPVQTRAEVVLGAPTCTLAMLQPVPGTPRWDEATSW